LDAVYPLLVNVHPAIELVDLELADVRERSTPAGIVVDLAVSQRTLAGMISASREEHKPCAGAPQCRRRHQARRLDGDDRRTKPTWQPYMNRDVDAAAEAASEDRCIIRIGPRAGAEGRHQSQFGSFA
jgi:hypothetical protein